MEKPNYDCIAYDLGSELENLKAYKKDLEKYTDFLENEKSKKLDIQGVGISAVPEDCLMHYDALKDCCNNLLDKIEEGKVPRVQIMGLKILLPR